MEAKVIEITNQIDLEIISLHERTVESALIAMHHAINCGRKLADRKRQIPHGQWESHVKTHYPFNARQAVNYMQVWQFRDIILEWEAHEIKGIEPSIKKAKVISTERARLNRQLTADLDLSPETPDLTSEEPQDDGNEETGPDDDRNAMNIVAPDKIFTTTKKSEWHKTSTKTLKYLTAPGFKVLGDVYRRNHASKIIEPFCTKRCYESGELEAIVIAAADHGRALDTETVEGLMYPKLTRHQVGLCHKNGVDPNDAMDIDDEEKRMAFMCPVKSGVSEAEAKHFTTILDAVEMSNNAGKLENPPDWRKYGKHIGNALSGLGVTNSAGFVKLAQQRNG